MEKQPLRVQLLTKKGESYQIKLPHLDIPVTVDSEIYQRMCNDPNYQFSNAVLAS
jgi:hypothetical protein